MSTPLSPRERFLKAIHRAAVLNGGLKRFAREAGLSYCSFHHWLHWGGTPRPESYRKLIAACPELDKPAFRAFVWAHVGSKEREESNPVGKLLCELRRESNLTLLAIQKRTKIAQSYLCMIETGARHLGPRNARRLVGAVPGWTLERYREAKQKEKDHAGLR